MDLGRSVELHRQLHGEAESALPSRRAQQKLGVFAHRVPTCASRVVHVLRARARTVLSAFAHICPNLHAVAEACCVYILHVWFMVHRRGWIHWAANPY